MGMSAHDSAYCGTPHTPQRADVLDFEAAHLELFEPVAGQHSTFGGSLGAGPPVHALADQEAPHRGV